MGVLALTASHSPCSSRTCGRLVLCRGLRLALPSAWPLPRTPAYVTFQEKSYLLVTLQSGLGLCFLLAPHASPPQHPGCYRRPCVGLLPSARVSRGGAGSVLFTSAFQPPRMVSAHSRWSIIATSFCLPGHQKWGTQGQPRPCSQPCLGAKLHGPRPVLIRYPHFTREAVDIQRG